MVVKTKKLLVASASIAMALSFSACKKDKDSQTDKLVGEWRLVQQDGVASDPDYETTFRFDADQDVRLCNSYDGTKYCYDGEWNWKDDDEDEIEMELTDDGYVLSIDLEVSKLNDDVLEGDLEVDGSTYDVEFEKVD